MHNIVPQSCMSRGEDVYHQLKVSLSLSYENDNEKQSLLDTFSSNLIHSKLADFESLLCVTKINFDLENCRFQEFKYRLVFGIEIPLNFQKENESIDTKTDF